MIKKIVLTVVHKQKINYDFCFRNWKSPEQPVSNKWLREGASNSAGWSGSSHYSHGEGLRSSQRTPRSK